MPGNVPYLVGNTYQRDYQYWPTITRAELEALVIAQNPFADPLVLKKQIDQAHPVRVNRDQMMALVWRVREWTIPQVTWSLTTIARDEPVGSIDDLAVRHDIGTIAECKPYLYRFTPQPPVPYVLPAIPIDDEKNILSWWQQSTLPKDFWPSPPAINPNIPRWKTLRNLGAFLPSPDVTFTDYVAIEADYSFVAPVVLVGVQPPDYDHAKFGEGGHVTNSDTGVVALFQLFFFAGYTIYDSSNNTFFPPLTLALGLPTQPNVNSVDHFFMPADPVYPIDPYFHAGDFTIDFGAASPLDNVVIPIAAAPPADYPNPIVVSDGTVQNTFDSMVDIEMDATAWFPFKNRLNEDIYDTTTGSPTGANPFA